MTLIFAKYKDICLGCQKDILPGQEIFWTKKLSYHKNCYEPVTITEKWLRK